VYHVYRHFPSRKKHFLFYPENCPLRWPCFLTLDDELLHKCVFKPGKYLANYRVCLNTRHFFFYINMCTSSQVSCKKRQMTVGLIGHSRNVDSQCGTRVMSPFWYLEYGDRYSILVKLWTVGLSCVSFDEWNFQIRDMNYVRPILIRSNKMQQCAGIYLLQNYSTCFGCPSHPSSGVHKTVTAASGTGHSI